MNEGSEHQARHLSLWGYLGILAAYIVVLIVASTFTLEPDTGGARVHRDMRGGR
jgi:hypothetical protein